jgi:hypothetical protein
MGIGFMYQTSIPIGDLAASYSFGYPYYSISLSLNVLITFIIVIRLVLHSKNVQNVMGAPTGNNNIYKAVIVILIESCAPYAISYLLFFVPWACGSAVANIFFPLLAEVQVCAAAAFSAISGW